MNQIPLRPIQQLPLPPPPVSADPPVLGDVTNILAYEQNVKKRKREDDGTVTDDEIAQVEIEKMKVIQGYGGQNVAPAWFAPAMQPILQVLQALQQGQQDLQQGQQALQQGQQDLQRYSYNGSAIGDMYSILPLADGNGNFPQAFPATKGELAQSTQATFNQLLAFYGLPQMQGGTVADLHAKKRAIFAHLGLR